jgi:preprotein translocase subunit SecE
VARDRKRAKQRQQRRRGPGRAHPVENGHEQGAPQITRADLPAALGHAGDVDEFDAALVRGAEGVPVADDADVEAAEIEFSEEGGASALSPEELAAEELASAGEELATGEELAPGVGVGVGAAGAGNGSEPPRGGASGELAPAAGDGGSGVTTAPVRVPARLAREQQSLPRRAVAFLRASWAELQRVQWPNRAQTTQATAVVLGFVAVAGVYFGIADYVAKEIVEAIL